MFDIGGWELLFLMVIALIVVGPKELPQLMRMVGRWTGRARAMVREFQASFEEMARQAELDEIKKEVGDIAGGKDLKNLQQQINQSVDNMVGTPKPVDTKSGYHPPAEESAGPDQKSTESDNPTPKQNTGAAG